MAEVRRRIVQREPEIVHCHNLFPALSPAVLRAADGRAPVIVTLHNYRLLCLPATFLRDGQICEDCLNRLPWPGVVHSCYQGSDLGKCGPCLVPGAAQGDRHVPQHPPLHRDQRLRANENVQGGLSIDQILVKPHFAWAVEHGRGPASTSCIWVDCPLKRESRRSWRRGKA